MFGPVLLQEWLTLARRYVHWSTSSCVQASMRVVVYSGLARFCT